MSEACGEKNVENGGQVTDGDSKLPPAGRIHTAACLCLVSQLRMSFTF